LASLLKDGQPLPAAFFGFSPLTDLTYSGESFKTNAQKEVVLPAESAASLGEMFLNGEPCNDPRVSPLEGDFAGAPPVWFTVGDTEILCDDSHRLAKKCEAQGVSVTLIERHDLPHVWPIFHNILPEARETLDQLGQWIRQQPGWQGES
jgi:acetyl esterase/lipase